MSFYGALGTFFLLVLVALVARNGGALMDLGFFRLRYYQDVRGARKWFQRFVKVCTDPGMVAHIRHHFLDRFVAAASAGTLAADISDDDQDGDNDDSDDCDDKNEDDGDDKNENDGQDLPWDADTVS